MNKHIIVGPNNQCLCGIVDAEYQRPIFCADIIKSIEEVKRHGQSWDGGLLVRVLEPLIVDVEQTQEKGR
jgi:hypothetical protein